MQSRPLPAIIYWSIPDILLLFLGCDSELINNTLKSPGYPGSYPDNTECQYHVPIPRNMTMNITFVDFDVENHQHCM